MQGDRYSRMVALLKVVLPLAALAILSTLFLLSRVTAPGDAIPFADKEIQDRLKNQQVTGPFFSGTTTGGDQISFSAETLMTPDRNTGVNVAQDVFAQLDLAAGGRMTVTSKQARIDIAARKASLTGGVSIATSTDYHITTDEIETLLSELNLIAPGTVTATGPAGTLTAGSMVLQADDQSSPAQLIFTNGVKLIYLPKQRQE